MHAILASIGSLGDTLPFVALGRRLLERGHRVTLVANGEFEALARDHGIAFAESITTADYHQFIEDQRNWTRNHTRIRLTDLMVRQTQQVYQAIVDLNQPGETVVAAQGYAFGARVAQETHDIPLATVHLHPLWMRSIYDTVGVPSIWPYLLPRAVHGLLDLAFDVRFGRWINEFRASLGLRPTRRLIREWWNSPDLILGWFPDWFTRPQRDWPRQVRLTGFPDLRLPSTWQPSEPLRRFLESGPRPLLFHHHHHVEESESFFPVSVETTRLLDHRAILLTTHPELVPSPLPDNVGSFGPIPLDWILERASAHIHPGSISIIAQTLFAGIPQVTVPLQNEQPDNSTRLLRLGVSRSIKPQQYQAPVVAQQLRDLLGSSEVTNACRDFARRCHEADSLGRSAELLEELHANRRPAPSRSRQPL